MHEGQQLEALVEHARGELLRIGKFLIDDGCIEIWNLIDQINDIKTSPLVEEFGIVFGGFCSQAGRLAGVMATMSKIGSTVCEVAEGKRNSIGGQTNHLTHNYAAMGSFQCEQLLKMQLQDYVGEFGRLSLELRRLIETDMTFIMCDASVLNDHPDLTKSDAIRIRFTAASDCLATLTTSWWGLAEEAREKGATYKAALAAHSTPHAIN